MNQNQRLFLMISLMFLLLLMLPAPQSTNSNTKSSNSTATDAKTGGDSDFQPIFVNTPTELKGLYYGEYKAYPKLPSQDSEGKIYISFPNDSRVISETLYNRSLAQWEQSKANRTDVCDHDSDDLDIDAGIDIDSLCPQVDPDLGKPKPEDFRRAGYRTRVVIPNSYLAVWHMISFHGTEYNSTTHRVSTLMPDMHVEKIWGSGAKNYSCPNSSLSLEIDNLEYNGSSSINPGYRIDLLATGGKCNSGNNFDEVESGDDDFQFSIIANLMPYDIIREIKLKNYVLTLIFFCFLNIYLIFHEIKNVVLSDTYARKYSLASISVLAITDLGTSILHFLKAFDFKEIHGIILLLTYFFLYLAFDKRLLLFCWRAQNPDVFQQDMEVRRAELGRFYSKFYGALLVVFILYILDSFRILLILASQLYWVPQIRYNAYKGHKNFFTPKLLVLLPISRIVFPLYLIACPENVMWFTQYPKVAITMIVLVIAQSLVLYLQGILGSRFFIPRYFLPPKYNYYQNFSDEGITQEGDIQECCVCLNKLNSSSDGGELDTKLMKIMVTPCGHKFHTNCLENWMDVKMECPVCRVNLPPLD
eukprot:CAMPEP_0115020354 /NCGR_PEP_ID=MMETSP0216-20121206/30056_1 /TAXON_ID=223996 /ORGANISM="Protocruzia adherens, Strain Boccale" /LENGTH=587 /DNA_ID=CAMNT_0002392133 /DNA_START=252 /DNA_END=2015 /DNA_ORIENTATION=+